MGQIRYVFWVRPAESDPLPKEWWERGAIAPLAILEASSRGVAVIQPSPAGQLLRLLATIGVGLGMGFGLVIPVFILAVEGRWPGGLPSWLLFNLLVSLPVATYLGVRARKLVSWRRRSTGISLHVIAVAVGIFRQELQVEDGFRRVWVSTFARASTVRAALRLSGQSPAIFDGA